MVVPGCGSHLTPARNSYNLATAAAVSTAAAAAAVTVSVWRIN
jgi:hypothetical protein